MRSRDPLAYRHRFIDIPGQLARRPRRRALRSGALWVSVFLAVVVGIAHAWGQSAGAIIISVGRSITGLVALATVGLIVGVLLTFLVVFLYNGVFNGAVSLLDLEYIDEIPLIFVFALGIAGVWWSIRWPDEIGLVGWGLVLLVGSEVLLKRPDHAE